MKLLTFVLPHGTRILPAGGWFTLLVVSSLIGLEIIGRFATTDLQDGMAALLLLGVVGSVAMRHRRDPLAWLTHVIAWLKQASLASASLHYEHGFDLRGTPPLPRRTPRIVWLTIGALAVWGVLAGLAWVWFPDGWRTIGVHTSYVLYLAGLLILWGILLTCGFVGLHVPVAVLYRSLRGWVGETDRKGAELAALVLYAILVATIAWFFRPSPVLALCLGVAACALVAYLPRGGDGPAMLWRSGSDQPVYAVPLHRVIAIVTAFLSLLLFDVLLMACGGRWLGVAAADQTMWVTAFIGAMAAWFVPGLVLFGTFWLWAAWRSDPSRQSPPTIHVAGAEKAERTTASAAIRAWGWRTQVEPVLRELGTVGVIVVQPAESEAAEFDPNWPLKVCGDDLTGGTVRPRLERRDEIQVRRQFFRGLAKLFKRASTFKGPGGGGYWLAPHWWFIDGISREESDGRDEETAPPSVGPPYQRILSSRARQQIYRVLRATQIDMLFIEDGVGYRKIEKVIRVLMELYDVHGGKRKAEELHFRGLPKIRVMIHDYEPGNPFQSNDYPEPKMDDLMRVRVLHVFRDRGGEVVEVEPPFDFSWSPAPVGVLG